VETAELAVIEALADSRIGGDGRSLPAAQLEDELAALLPGISVSELEKQGLVERWGENVQLVVDGGTTLDEQRTGRSTGLRGAPTQGELLAAFAHHCREELEDVDVLEESPSRLVLRSAHEPTALELRAGLLFCERLGRDAPTLVLSELTPEVVERLSTDEDLRGRVAAYDLDRLEKMDAVGAGVFGYFESFLRDAYGASVREHPALHGQTETRRSS
jgi:hypothetical protein